MFAGGLDRSAYLLLIVASSLQPNYKRQDEPNPLDALDSDDDQAPKLQEKPPVTKKIDIKLENDLLDDLF